MISREAYCHGAQFQFRVVARRVSLSVGSGVQQNQLYLVKTHPIPHDTVGKSKVKFNLYLTFTLSDSVPMNGFRVLLYAPIRNSTYDIRLYTIFFFEDVFVRGGRMQSRQCSTKNEFTKTGEASALGRNGAKSTCCRSYQGSRQWRQIPQSQRRLGRSHSAFPCHEEEAGASTECSS